MSKETRKVLELLENGKITAEEAEKLLRAIGSSSSQEPREDEKSTEEKQSWEGIEHTLDKVSEVVTKAVSAAKTEAKKYTKRGEYQFTGVNNVEIKVGKGDLEFGVDDEGLLKASIEGIHKVTEDGKTVYFSLGMGEAQITTPPDAIADIKVGLGDIEFDSSVVGDLSLKLGTGDICGELSFDKAEIKVGMGDIDVKIPNPGSGSMAVGRGDVQLGITGVKLDINVDKDSDVEFPEDVKIVKDGIRSKRRKIVAIIGDEAEHELEISIGSGDLSIND